MSQKILITGALGHIGSAFIHALRPGDFDEVVLVDDMSAQRYCSMFHLPQGVRYRFVETDVCVADLRRLLAGVDVVLHLAAVTDATTSFDRKDHVERVNFEATRKIADACIELGRKLIFPSTTSVYGMQDDMVDEDCQLEKLKPQSPYAEAKLKSEQLLAQKVDLRFVTIRMGTIFGVSPGMRFHTAVNKFIWQACIGQPLTVWRTALDQLRPYLAVLDAVRAIRFLIDRDIFDRRIYNIVTLNATVRQVVDGIRRRIPEAQIELVDSRIMNQLSYNVASARIRSLGFEFTGDLERDIQATVELLRNGKPVAP